MIRVAGSGLTPQGGARSLEVSDRAGALVGWVGSRIAARPTARDRRAPFSYHLYQKNAPKKTGV